MQQEKNIKTYEPGLYFGMPFDEYLAIPALSNSGIKDFMSSPYRFWTNSWMNRDRKEREEKDYHIFGTAYHCRILEGKDVFYSQYAPEFDSADYPDALGNTEEIKDVLREYKEAGYDVRISGNKPFLIEQLLSVNPNAKIMDDLKNEHAKKHAGKILLSQDLIDEIEKAAYMVSLHPDASRAFSGGYPEVTVIFEVNGIMHKCRFDYLKIACHSELKTFNMSPRNLDRVPANETAKYRYHIQYTLYCEAAAWARKFAACGKCYKSAMFDGCLKPFPVVEETLTKWLHDFAAYDGEHKAVCVFVQKELAEIRGKIFGDSLTMDCAKVVIDEVRARFKECLDKYGECVPWLEPSPFDDFVDEDFPQYMFMD